MELTLCSTLQEKRCIVLDNILSFFLLRDAALYQWKSQRQDAMGHVMNSTAKIMPEKQATSRVGPSLHPNTVQAALFVFSSPSFVGTNIIVGKKRNCLKQLLMKDHCLDLK